MSDARWPVPETWSWSSAGQIADIVGGGTPSAKNPTNFAETGIPWITPADLTGFQGAYIKRGARDLSDQGYRTSSAKIMPEGTVLFSSRAPIGHCAIAANPISTNQGFKSLVLPGDISSEFVRLYLVASKDYADSKASGTTFRELSGSRMATLAIPIPPLPEQRRIVAKLDRLSARSAAAREHLARTALLAARAKQATLAAAFDDEQISGWRTVRLEEVVADALIGLVRSKSEQMAAGIPYIRMNHYDLAGRWNTKDLTCVSVTSDEAARYELRRGDLLFNTRNSRELVGKVAIWPDGRPGHVYNNNLLRLRLDHAVDPDFAFLLMTAPPFRAYLETVKSATTSVAAIYQRSLLKAPFLFPSLSEQREIVRRIEAAFARIDRLTEEAARAAHLLDRLDERLLARAFRGELVPQDPADEPAEALLARIREARAAAPKPKRRRKARPA